MISNFKKRRYKPLYKNFIGLKKNIQNRQKLNSLRFKKRKWAKLILYLKRLQLRRKKNFRMYDIGRFFLPKFYNSFKHKHSYVLKTKNKLKLFYGGLSKNYVKNCVKLTDKNYCISSKIFKTSNSFLVGLFENRLDIILYRSHFALSIRAARQLICHSQIKVNGVKSRTKSLKVKKGDVIAIGFFGRKKVELSIANSYLWPLPPKYLQINYKTLQISFKNGIEYQNFANYFPFWLDFHTIKRYFIKTVRIFNSSVGRAGGC